MTDKKIKAYEALKAIVAEKIIMAREEISSIKESQGEETKSSAGDKYETSREMMQLELDKAGARLEKALDLEKELKLIDLKKAKSEAGFGSLVLTNAGVYFISIGLGGIKVEGDTFFAVSLASPIGMILKGKKLGDSFNFQSKTIKILEIL